MKYHVTRIDPIDLQTKAWSTTHRSSETESEKTNASTDYKDDAQETHLLSPRSLLSFRWLAKAFQDGTGAPKGDDTTVYIPKTWWANCLSVIVSPLLFHGKSFSVPPR
jgi:hypothetical protein